MLKVSVFQRYREEAKSKAKEDFFNELNSLRSSDKSSSSTQKSEMYWGRVFSKKNSNFVISKESTESNFDTNLINESERNSFRGPSANDIFK